MPENKGSILIDQQRKKGDASVSSAQEKSSKKRSPAKDKRLTVTFSSDTIRMLEILSDLQSVSQSEALRRAVSTESFIRSELQKKSKIYVETVDGKTKEIVFR